MITSNNGKKNCLKKIYEFNNKTAETIFFRFGENFLIFETRIGKI
jgi:hypothetical protein